MSSGRWWLAVACAWAGVAGAQERAELERRVDSLAAEMRAARARHQMYADSVRRLEQRRDTLMVGPLRLELGSPAFAGMARYAADSALRALTPLYGRALERLRGHTFVLRVEPASRYRPDELVLAVLDDRRAETRGRWGAADSAILTQNFRDVMLQVLSDPSLRRTSVAGAYDPAALRSWLRTDLPVDSPKTAEYATSRLQMLSTPTRVARRCYDGVLTDCRMAFGLAQAEDPATQWFDSASRHQFVLKDRFGWRRIRDSRDNALRALAERCEAGVDSACIQAIRRYPPPGLPDPLPTWNRLQLLRLAIGMGGDGAMERALAQGGTVDDRLAAAARIPTDSLLRLYVNRARETTRESTAMSGGIMATAAFWTVLCLGLSLRSSRWR